MNKFYVIFFFNFLVMTFCGLSVTCSNAQTVSSAGLPANITLVNNADINITGKKGKVCVIGGATIASPTVITETDLSKKQYTFDNPAVYLTSSKGVGYFTPFTANQLINALELGVDIKTLNPMADQGSKGLNNIFYAGARLYFYYVSPYIMPLGFRCSDIQFTVAPGQITPVSNTPTGPAPYPYPMGVLEVTLAPKPGNTPNVYTNLDYDYQNVDNIQLLLSSTLQYPSSNPASFGNVSAKLGSTKYLTAINLTTGNVLKQGGTFYPAFLSWLQSQAGWMNGKGPASKFVDLGNTTSTVQKQVFYANTSTNKLNSAFPQINSSKGFIANNLCTKFTDGAYHPNSVTITDVIGNPYAETCTAATNNFSLGFLSQLNTYYEDDLSGFFSDVQHGLKVWSDDGGGGQQIFTGSSSTKMCPYFTIEDKMALFTGKSYSFGICNIAYGSNPLPPETGYPRVTQAQSLIPSGCNKNCGVKFQNTAVITLSSAQVSYIRGILSKLGDTTNGVGWLLNQIDSSWSGQITSALPNSPPYDVHVNVIATDKMTILIPPQEGPVKQTQCLYEDSRLSGSCHATNLSQNWTFSKVSTTNLSEPKDTGTSQVFQNAGQFAAWVGSDTYATSVMRNIATAFSRGVYRCNNLSMSQKTKPPECQYVVKGTCTPPTQCDFNDAGVLDTSDAYWSLEKNWYPANGHQDYYSEYVHTVQVYENGFVTAPPGTPTGSVVQAWATPPASGFWSTLALSNQGRPMGMGYGFGFDEDPDYISKVPQIKPPGKQWPGPSPSYYAHVPAEFYTLKSLESVAPTSLTVTVAPYW